MAKRFEKRHDHITRDIRIFLKKNPEFSKHFFESSYISSRGRCYFEFEMDDIGADILRNKFKYNVRSARFEYKYLNEIKDFLEEMSIHYILQFQVGVYKIDLYIPKYNIAIEIDEEEHKYKREHDIKRQDYIESQIHCKFICVNEGGKLWKCTGKAHKKIEFDVF